MPEGSNTELFTPLGKGVAVRPEGRGGAGAARMKGFVDGWVAESSGKGGGLARRPGVISESFLFLCSVPQLPMDSTHRGLNPSALSPVTALPHLPAISLSLSLSPLQPVYCPGPSSLPHWFHTYLLNTIHVADTELGTSEAAPAFQS